MKKRLSVFEDNPVCLVLLGDSPGGLSGRADCSAAAESSSVVATLRKYEVEPTAAGVLGVLRQWQPSAENSSADCPAGERTGR